MFEDLLKSLKREPKDFDYWLFVAKVCHQRTRDGTMEKIYVNPEEEIFEESSEIKFELNDPKLASATGNNTFRIALDVFLVPTPKIDDVLKKIIDMSQ